MLILLLANLAFWGYTQGHLAGLGWAPHDPREPQRLAQQVAPEALVVLNAAGGETASSPTATQGPEPEPPEAEPTPPALDASPPLPATCWLATGLPPAQEVLVRAALEHMDGMNGRWNLTESLLPARWIVYLGPFPNDAALQQRRSELRRANIDHRELSLPSLSPGLALGTYSTREAAQRALADLSRQGVAGARVVQERPDTAVYTLRLEGVTDAQRRRIEAMGILRDRPLQRCP